MRHSILATLTSIAMASQDAYLESQVWYNLVSDEYHHHQVSPVELHGNTMSSNAVSSCWVKTYGRGVGKPITTCPAGQEKDGALCYPQCQPGYNGVGPVCWQTCPSGFRNDGAYCYKPDAYGRGAGKISQCSNCEKSGGLWYPKCKENFHNTGCCICSPDCPSGMTDIGISCQKQSYGRTAGTPLQCKPDEVYDAGLCYPACSGSTNGVGPVCWGSCPAGTTNCGGALCLTPDEPCSDYIIKNVKNIGDTVTKLAEEDYAGAAIDITKVALDYAYPTCQAYSANQLWWY